MQDFQEYSRIVQAEVLQLIRDLCRIPAPSHHEEARAAFCQKWFIDNGFPCVWTDEALNVLAPVRIADNGPVTVMMAHTDTVFPDMEPMPFISSSAYSAPTASRIFPSDPSTGTYSVPFESVLGSIT